MFIIKPIIGITCSNDEDKRYFINRPYCNSILCSGGVPIIIPYLMADIDGASILRVCDGLLLSGGIDLDPFLFGEEPKPGLGRVEPDRDQTDLMLTRLAIQMRMPILAICRGFQVLNVALGGTLYQDIYNERDQNLQHQQNAPRDHLSHSVNVIEGTRLYEIMGTTKIKVNSFHHQAVKELGENLQTSAIANDGIIEAIEGKDKHNYMVGVQWHPEHLVENDKYTKQLFRSFVAACH